MNSSTQRIPRTAILTLACLSVLSAPATAQGLPEDPRELQQVLERRWTENPYGLRAGRAVRITGERPSPEIPAERFAELLALARGHAETWELVEEVTEKLGAGTPEELREITLICREERGTLIGRSRARRRDEIGTENGHFASRGGYFFVGKTAPDTGRTGISESVRRTLRGAIESYREDREGYIFIRYANRPKICIRDGLSVAGSYLTFVHELEHFRGHDLRHEIDMLDVRDEGEYAARRLDAPGSEVEAFISQGKAMMNLLDRVPGLRLDGYYWLRGHFTDDGHVRDLTGLRRRIGGIYASRFRSDYRSEAVEAYNRAAGDFNRLGTLHNSAVSNYNNFERARARSRNPETIERYTRIRDFYREQIRIFRRLRARLQRRMNELAERYGQFFAPAREERPSRRGRRIGTVR